MTSKKKIIANAIQNIVGVESVELIAVSPETPEHIFCHIYTDPELVVERLTPEEVQRRNYNANVRRGKITDQTTKLEFVEKCFEELHELKMAIINKDIENEKEEMSDVSHVIDAMAYHYSIDLQAEKEKKLYINESRKD